jgi:hypothetical protein
MAMVYSIKKESRKALEYLDKAFAAGYLNFKELDTSHAFLLLKENQNSKISRQSYNILFLVIQISM